MVATDSMGVAGRAIRHALVGGETDAAALAALAGGRLRSKRAEWERALSGRFGSHQRVLRAEHLLHLDASAARIERLTAEIGVRLTAQAAVLEQLDTIPGVADGWPRRCSPRSGPI